LTHKEDPVHHLPHDAKKEGDIEQGNYFHISIFILIFKPTNIHL